MRFKHLLAVLTLLVANLIAPTSCLAQNGTTAAGASNYARVTPPQEIKHERLTSMPRDLKVPLPPDAKFMGGYRSQYSSSRQITELRFQSTNALSKIADWYQKSLAGTGWTVKVGATTSQASALTAFKPGLFCSMNFRQAGATGIPTAAGTPSSSIIMMNYSETR